MPDEKDPCEELFAIVKSIFGGTPQADVSLAAAEAHYRTLKTDHKLAIDNLTSTQERCNDLFDANRGYRLHQCFDIVVGARWRFHVRPPKQSIAEEIYDRMVFIDHKERRIEKFAEIAALCLMEIEKSTSPDPLRTTKQQADREKLR